MHRDVIEKTLAKRAVQYKSTAWVNNDLKVVSKKIVEPTGVCVKSVWSCSNRVNKTLSLSAQASSRNGTVAPLRVTVCTSKHIAKKETRFDE